MNILNNLFENYPGAKVFLIFCEEKLKKLYQYVKFLEEILQKFPQQRKSPDNAPKIVANEQIGINLPVYRFNAFLKA